MRKRFPATPCCSSARCRSSIRTKSSRRASQSMPSTAQPGRRGVEEILKHFQGEVLDWTTLQKVDAGEIGHAYITANYPDPWIDDVEAARFERLGRLIGADILPSPLARQAHIGVRHNIARKRMAATSITRACCRRRSGPFIPSKGRTLTARRSATCSAARVCIAPRPSWRVGGHRRLSRGPPRVFRKRG